MTLRVYVSETQLSKIKVGQQVTVKIDWERNEILSRNSFLDCLFSRIYTKIIQTKEERVNLVYAVKISVKNDGGLKIGMPAEMWITPWAKKQYN
jgi:HlyD family secretion protein